MPVDSNGNISRATGQIPVTGQGADAPQINSPIDDIYAILNMLVFRDGRKALTGNLPMNGYRATGAANGVDPQDLVSLAQVEALIAAVQGVPTGAIFVMAGTQVSTGYLRLDGSSVLRSAAPNLYAFAVASGNMAATQGAKTDGQFGPGDGSTTFTLPKIVDFIRGLDTGRTIGSSQADDLKSHLHPATFAGDPMPPHGHPGILIAAGAFAALANGTGVQAGGVTPASAGTPTGSVFVTAVGGVETRPKNIAYPYVIKT